MTSGSRVVWADQVTGVSLMPAQTDGSYGVSSTGVSSSASISQQMWSGPSDRISHQGIAPSQWPNPGLNGRTIASVQGPTGSDYLGGGTWQTSSQQLANSVFQPRVHHPIMFPPLSSQGQRVQWAPYTGHQSVPQTVSQRVDDQHRDADRTVSLVMNKRSIETLRTFIKEDLKSAFQEVNSLNPQSSKDCYQDAMVSFSRVEGKVRELHNEYVEATKHANQVELAAIMDDDDKDIQGFNGQLRALKGELERKRSCRVTTPTTSYSQGTKFAHLERVKLPDFDGKFEHWPRFKQEWMDLQKDQNTTDAIQLRQLREKIPRTAQEMISGIGPLNGGIKAAFDRLEREYGDRDLNILTVQKRLDSFCPKAKENHAKVEELCHEVERAANLLRGMGAEQELVRERGLVGRLVSKLPAAYQNIWDEYVTSPIVDQRASKWVIFQEWLTRQREIALNAKKRSMELSMGTDTKLQSSGAQSRACHKCGQEGHFARNCRMPVTRTSKLEEVLHLKAKEMSSKREFEEALPELKEKIGSCKICNKEHTYDRTLSFGSVKWPSSLFKGCPEYNKMKVDERSRKVEENKGCAICTSWLHATERCWLRNKQNNCQALEKGKKCGQRHDTSLHGSSNRYCQVNAVTTVVASCDLHPDESIVPAAPVLLRVQEIEVGVGDKKAKTLVLFDPGSTATLITHEFAERLGLTGVDITYFLKVVGQGYARKRTKAYQATILDNHKRVWKIDLLGIEAITSVDSEVDLTAIQSTFPEAPKEVFYRPAGAVNILVGSNYECLQPFGGKLRGGLRLLDSHFGVGKVLCGTDPRVGYVGDNITTEAHHMTSAALQLPEGAMMVEAFYASLKLPLFMEAEELGTAPARNCKRCRDCKQCSYRGQMISRDEEMVVKMVEDTMYLDEESSVFRVSYPWKPESDKQVSNKEQALAIQRKVETRLIKAGRLQE